MISDEISDEIDQDRLGTSVRKVAKQAAASCYPHRRPPCHRGRPRRPQSHLCRPPDRVTSTTVSHCLSQACHGKPSRVMYKTLRFSSALLRTDKNLVDAAIKAVVVAVRRVDRIDEFARL